MNAFVLAGHRGASHPIFGMNKAFLKLEGVPLFLHVLKALDRSRKIDRIYMIGPQKKIMEEIERALPFFLFGKKVEVFEEKDSLAENILSVYTRSLPGYRDGVDPGRLDHGDPPGLFLPVDIPLLTAAEVDAFISAADLDRYDYCLGVTPERALLRFYPEPGRPGIKMPYVYIKGEGYRLNNLHLARPFRIGLGKRIQGLYDRRYQKYFGNRIQIALEILRSKGTAKGLLFYFLAQAAAFSHERGFRRLTSFFTKPLTLSAVEKEASRFLQTRFKAVTTEIGGAAIDIDDEATYQTVSARFEAWRNDLARFDSKEEETFCQMKTNSHHCHGGKRERCGE
ncbi:MAG: NTP transferase domain-containing protein [Candidatus Manganitrophaceae bacterium]